MLNINYEAVPQLDKMGVECPAGDQKRIDLILRDKIHRTPVVVEFKFDSFTRQDIGQILEYKARLTTTFNRENDPLFQEFGEFVLAPQLVLVVKACDDFSRVACNLSGIQVYEYKNFYNEINEPGKMQGIRAFQDALESDPFPISHKRREWLEEKIYGPMKKVLAEHNLYDVWPSVPRSSNSYFYPEFADMFINRWLFNDKTISMGIFEDVIEKDMRICVCYYTTNLSMFEKFCEVYKAPENSKIDTVASEWNEGFVHVKFDRKYFFENLEAIFKKELEQYLELQGRLTAEISE